MAVPVDFSHFFHRSSGSGAQDHWNVGFLRCYRSGNLGLWMKNTLHPDRGQKHRSLELMTEDGRLGAQFASFKTVIQRRIGWYLQITGSAVSQHAGDDGPLIEIFAIGFIGLPYASAPENIEEST